MGKLYNLFKEKESSEKYELILGIDSVSLYIKNKEI